LLPSYQDVNWTKLEASQLDKRKDIDRTKYFH
jgi:hypothetical protein